MRRIYTILRSHARLWRSLFWLFIGVSAAFALFRLFALLFLQGIDDAPYPIFFSMGRAILNGLTPYEDIFETKPPGMFVMAALSLGIFRSTILANILQTLLLILPPILFFPFPRRNAREERTRPGSA